MSIQFKDSDSMIASFAKATKISKAKLAEFVSALQASAVAEGGSMEEFSVSRRKEESRKVLTYIQEHEEELSQKEMTHKQLADIIGLPPYVVGNSVKWLADNRNNVKYTGVAAKTPGQRGRKAVTFTLIRKQEHIA